MHEIHEFELQIETNDYDPCTFRSYLSSSKKGLKNLCLNGESHPDLFYQLVEWCMGIAEVRV